MSAAATAANASSLQAELDAFKAQFVSQAPKEALDVMTDATAQVVASGIEKSGLQAGDKMPAFELKDVNGTAHSSAALLAKGPLVVVFYRGGWCPYCNLQLRAYAKAHPQIAAAGASLVAISPEAPDFAAETAKSGDLPFPVLSDAGLDVERKFGLVFELTPELQKVYDSFGINLPARNGADKWELPLPAVFVVGADGVVATAHRPADYTIRKEPSAIVADLQALTGSKA